MFVGYAWAQWLELDIADRIDGIAHFRIHRLLDMHRQDAVSQDAEAQARKSRRH